MPDLPYRFRLAERHLLDATLQVARAKGTSRSQRLRWIAAIALSNEEPDGLPALIAEIGEDVESRVMTTHLKQAHRILTRALARYQED